MAVREQGEPLQLPALCAASGTSDEELPCMMPRKVQRLAACLCLSQQVILVVVIRLLLVVRRHPGVQKLALVQERLGIEAASTVPPGRIESSNR